RVRDDAEEGPPRPEDHDQPSDGGDAEHAGREQGDLAPAVLAEGVEERGQHRGRVERVHGSDREHHDDEEHEGELGRPVGLPPVPTRVLILSASIGEGHDRPAHWLAEQIRTERPDTVVVIEDSLDAMGGLVTLVSETAPQVVFHRFRWLWDLGFWAFTGPAPARSLVQRGLARVGGPGVLRLVAEVNPDVIVSVYPQATEVASRLRRQGRICVPVVAGITDVAALDYWASPGADLHLVTQPEAIDEVRQIAGEDADVHTVT